MKPVVLIGEARDEVSAKRNTDFVGASGVELIRMLGEAGLIEFTAQDRDFIFRYYKTQDPECLECIWNLHPEVYRTNVFRQPAPRGDLEHFCGGKADGIPGYGPLIKSKYVREEFFHSELDRLGDELVFNDPNLIVCLGNAALWAMAGRTGITKLRGTTLLSTHTATGFKLLPTYHPTAVIRQWENRPTVIADLMKAIREKEYADIRRPTREIWIEPSLEDIRTFVDKYIKSCKLLSVDIETSGNRVTCIGFAPSTDRAIVIPFDDERRKHGSYWATREDERIAWKLVTDILKNRAIPKLFQNGAYDVAFLWRRYGIKTMNAAEDTMLLQHALQPESLKGLGYLGSVYSDEGAWKHMRKKHETIKRDD